MMNAPSASPPRLPDDLLITGKLKLRPARPRDADALTQAMLIMCHFIALEPARAYETIAEFSLLLCGAHTAGISCANAARTGFQWRALCGRLRHLAGSELPGTPCNLVLGSGSPALLARPERHFGFAPDVDPPILEALVCPFLPKTQPQGTLWVVAHSELVHFDEKDAATMEELCSFGCHCVDTLYDQGYIEAALPPERASALLPPTCRAPARAP